MAPLLEELRRIRKLPWYSRAHRLGGCIQLEEGSEAVGGLMCS